MVGPEAATSNRTYTQYRPPHCPPNSPYRTPLQGGIKTMDPTPKTSPDEVVTLVVKHLIKPGREADYEAWLRRIVRIAGERPGHLGVDVVRSKQNRMALFTCVLRYRSTGDLERWLDSPERQALINEATPMLADGDNTEVGAVNEFW